MSATAITIPIPIVNKYNFEIESQVLLDKIHIEITKFTLMDTKPILNEFFFEDLPPELPLPSTVRDTSVVNRISKFFRTGFKSSISSFGSTMNLLVNISSKD